MSNQDTKVCLDWKAYFDRFIEVHGEPIVYQKTRLLFSDGWQYSLASYQGPEYPPPELEKRLNELQLTYWQIYSKKIEDEANALHRQIVSLEEWQNTRELPLQQRVVYKTWDDDGKLTSVSFESEDLDLEPLRAKYRDLINIVQVCHENLDEKENLCTLQSTEILKTR